MGRILSRDGRFNIAKKGRRRIFFSDLYHSLLAASWPAFFLFVLSFYLSTNLIFASAFFLCGPQGLAGAGDVLGAGNGTAYFLECFFFSVQTLATIGYGRVSPIGIAPNLLVTLEALVGALSLAVITGLLYARFARPTARIIFSRVAVVTEQDGIPYFLFRMANERLNQISEARVSVVLLKNETTVEGESYRDFHDLPLERRHSPIFNMTWTVEHAIDASSPLYGKNKEDLIRDQVEILVTLTGTDDTFIQPIQARFSYTPEEILWNARFKDVLSHEPDGTIRIALEDIHALK